MTLQFPKNNEQGHDSFITNKKYILMKKKAPLRSFKVF